jgi:hypothetical protein
MTHRDYNRLLSRIGRLERTVNRPDSVEGLELYTLKAAAIAVAEGYAKPSEIEMGGRL